MWLEKRVANSLGSPMDFVPSADEFTRSYRSTVLLRQHFDIVVPSYAPWKFNRPIYDSNLSRAVLPVVLDIQ